MKCLLIVFIILLSIYNGLGITTFDFYITLKKKNCSFNLLHFKNEKYLVIHYTANFLKHTHTYFFSISYHQSSVINLEK